MTDAMIVGSHPTRSPFPEKFIFASHHSGACRIVAAIKSSMRRSYEEKAPTAPEVAVILGMSLRSLQRMLALAGLKYSDLLDMVRFEIAAELLQSTDDKVIDIAFAAGYSDPAHFARAFRRMVGTTPRNFRNQSRCA